MKTYHDQAEKLPAMQTAKTRHMKGKAIERIARNSLNFANASMMAIVVLVAFQYGGEHIQALFGEGLWRIFGMLAPSAGL